MEGARAMELILDEDGKVKVVDGLPVYKYEDGSESPFNAKTTLDNLNAKIGSLEEEKTRHYTKSETLKKDLKVFKGIDPKVALEAIETVKNLKTKELLDSSGVKVLKQEMREGFDAELREKDETWKKIVEEKEVLIATKASTIKHQAITQKFANSEFFSGKTPKTIYPPDDAVRIFGHMFEVEGEGKDIVILAKDKEGKTVMSQKNHGDPANFNEAMGKFIEEHPDKARILNTNPGGPPAGGNLGTGEPGKFSSPTERIAAGLKQTGKFDG